MALDINLYNSLTRKKEVFKPLLKGEVKMYSCGPTVYQYAHIGNMRTNLLSDLIRRLFEFNGYKVTQVINITDVGHLVGDVDDGEDKIEQTAQKEKRSAKDIADFYLSAYLSDLEKLNIKTENTLFPKATDHIADQIELIKILENKGYTYRTSDGIYFDSSKYSAYPDLAGLDPEGLREGARIEANPEKKNPTDFALWKFSPAESKRQQEWESPWGIGFPGWHIECSAMSMKYLGHHFDLHSGGMDLLSVHHTNERAQSECATGETFANYWLHGGFITIEGEKMAKSLGNVYRLCDLEEKGYSPLAYRYWLLTGSYRKTINFTFDALEGSEEAYKKLSNRLSEITSDSGPGTVNEDYLGKFLQYINDDLNTAAGIALIWDLLKDTSLAEEDRAETIFHFDNFLGLKLRESLRPIIVPEQISKLVAERETARQEKNYSKSDELRAEINELGYNVEDSASGPKIRKQ